MCTICGCETTIKAEEDSIEHPTGAHAAHGHTHDHSHTDGLHHREHGERTIDFAKIKRPRSEVGHFKGRIHFLPAPNCA